MHSEIRKRLHQHGGSKAIDLPANFVKQLPSDYVTIEEKKGTLIIRSVDELSAMESDPYFLQFIECIYADALAHPEKLKRLEEVWDEEWKDLLVDVDDDAS